MGYSSARLFAWLQSADFYINLHSEAITDLPQGEGKKWVDVGCGPGLLTRLAAAKGHNAMGIDKDPLMIREAKKIVRNENSSAVFEVGDVFQIPEQSADVVSASSLLAVLDDKTAGFRSLLKIVKPGGLLLIIEPTDRMTLETANAIIQTGVHNGRINGLRVWARARQGRATDPRILNAPEANYVSFAPLLGGLVGAWTIQKSGAVEMTGEG